MLAKICNLPDPRSKGSKNPGATNMLRVAGRKLAALTLIGDASKGILPLLVARHLNLDTHWFGYIGLAAFLGHLFPVYYGFKGGKGVATCAGVLFGLYWPVGLMSIALWAGALMILGYSSLAALIAASATPLLTFLVGPRIFLAPIGLMSALLLYKHKANILRLIEGKEDKVNFKK